MSPAETKGRARNAQELYDEIKGNDPRSIRRCFILLMLPRTSDQDQTKAERRNRQGWNHNPRFT